MPSEYSVNQVNAYLEQLVPQRPAELCRMEEYAQNIDFPSSDDGWISSLIPIRDGLIIAVKQ